MKKNFIWITAAALVIFASACSGGKKENKPGKPGEIRGSDIIRASETGATFVGKCQDLQFQGRTIYVESRFTFMNEKARDNGLPLYSEQIEMYDDSGCKSSDHIGTTIAEGDYNFGPDGQRALITYRSYLFTPHRDKFTDSLNGSTYCGLNNWQTGVGHELSVEGNCWDNVKAASYLLTVLDRKGDKLQVYNCQDELASVPSADCMRVKVDRVE